MAELSSSASNVSTLPFLHPYCTTTHIQHCCPLHSLITVKIMQDNYLFWKAQVVPYLKGQHLYGFIYGSFSCQPLLIDSPLNQTIPNSAHTSWMLQFQLILGALNSSISKSIFSHVVNCNSPHKVCLTLKNMFIASSRAHSMNLHYQLAIPKKGSSNIANYFHKFTSLADTLAVANEQRIDFELVSFFH